jgi:hypothetical protein
MIRSIDYFELASLAEAAYYCRWLVISVAMNGLALHILKRALNSSR